MAKFGSEADQTVTSNFFGHQKIQLQLTEVKQEKIESPSYNVLSQINILDK